MKTHFTTGPWHTAESKDARGVVSIDIVAPKEYVATVATASIDGGPEQMLPTGHANAALIAAAPELLDALVNMVRESMAKNGRVSAKSSDIACMAIAKALNITA